MQLGANRVFIARLAVAARFHFAVAARIRINGFFGGDDFAARRTAEKPWP
jgi:hypothetical protein